MSLHDTKSIGYYKRFAQAILKDIDLLREDAEFSNKGGQTLLAADFSEIFSYCMSASDSFLSSKERDVIDSGWGRTILNEIHDSIMLFYMFEAGQPLWLLDPYAVELRNFVRGLNTGEFSATLRDSAEAFRQLKAASEHESYAELTELARSMSSSEGAGRPALDDASWTRLANFIEQVAPALVLVSRDSEAKPMSRVQRLLGEGRVMIPSDLPLELQHGDPLVFERWLNALNQRRKNHEAQNASDALAVSIIYGLNKFFGKQDRPKKLVLLCRSTVMGDLMREDVLSGFWDEAGGNCIRHPRGLLALLNNNAEIVSLDDSAQQIETLNYWDRTFQIVSQDIPSSKNFTTFEFMNRHLAVIRDVWKRYCGVNAMRITIDNNYLSKHQTMQAIATLVEPTRLKRTVRQRLDRLGSQLGSLHFGYAALMSDELQVAIHHKRKHQQDWHGAVPTEAPTRSDGSLYQIRNAYGSPVPFRVAISDDRIRNVLEMDGDDPFACLSSMSTEVMRDRPQREEEATYANRTAASEIDWYVAMAYICGAIGAWQAAKGAAEFAISESAGHSVEAVLLSARATRNTSEDVAELRLATEALIELSSRSEKIEMRLRPERLKMRAILHLRESELLSDPTEQLVDLVSALKQSYSDSIESDFSIEKIELLNNVLYHGIQIYEKFDVDEIQFILAEGLKAFEALVLEYYGPQTSYWPDNFLDTAVWSRFYLTYIDKNGFLFSRDDFDITSALEGMGSLVNRDSLSLSDKADFKRHYYEIKSFFERRN